MYVYKYKQIIKLNDLIFQIFFKIYITTIFMISSCYTSILFILLKPLFSPVFFSCFFSFFSSI